MGALHVRDLRQPQSNVRDRLLALPEGFEDVSSGVERLGEVGEQFKRCWRHLQRAPIKQKMWGRDMLHFVRAGRRLTS
jgi:hypothetical protein